MADYRIFPVFSSGSSESRAVQRQKLQAQLAKMMQQRIAQILTKKSFIHWTEEAFNPVRMRQNFRRLEENRRAEVKKGPSRTVEERAIEETKSAEETASRFQRNNPELRKQTLLLLNATILEGDSVEDIIRKVLGFYPDLSLADEALDYLIATTPREIAEKVLQAKEQLNAEYSREIIAGKNIHLQARVFSEQGLGSPTALRDMYRDITGTRREPVILFDQLTEQFSFDELKTVIRFLLHSLGSDLKSKGPSIDRAQLLRHMEDARNLQAILGVYRFFKGRMGLITSLFATNNLVLPMRLGFEQLSKQFMALLQERYLTAEKIFQLGRKMGISEEILAEIIIFTQMRDAVRQISPRLYNNQQQKDDLLAAILDALEELEEELEKEEEEEKEEE